MDKRKVLPLLAIEKAHIYKCTYNMMWQLSSTLLKKLKHSSIVSEHKLKLNQYIHNWSLQSYSQN